MAAPKRFPHQPQGMRHLLLPNCLLGETEALKGLLGEDEFYSMATHNPALLKEGILRQPQITPVKGCRG